MKVIGFVCDWAVSTEALLDAQGRLLAHPSVHVVRIPCSGFMRPDWLEESLRAGADGTFVTGCPYGDCLNREGNYLMRDRAEQLARRLQRRRPGGLRMTQRRMRLRTMLFYLLFYIVFFLLLLFVASFGLVAEA